MKEPKLSRLILNSEYQLVSRPTTKLEKFALSVNRHYLSNIFVSTVILLIQCVVSLFTDSFSTNKFTVLLFCSSILTGTYIFFNVWVSVHCKSVLYKEPTRCNFGSMFISHCRVILQWLINDTAKVASCWFLI